MDPIIKNSLQCWLPVKLDAQNALLCTWRYTKGISYNDPFFDATIQKFFRLPENTKRRKCLTTPDILAEWGDHIDAVPPTAFIFHVSRCGSTLVSQALGMSKQNISVSEVPLFDEILRLPYQVNHINNEDVGKWLSGAIRFYGAKRTGEERRLYIKTDSWHLMFYKQIRRLYPDTPFVVIYRDPSEVLQSNRRKGGVQGIAGMIEPAIYGFSEAVIEANFHPDQYMELVLGSFFNSIIDMAENDGRTLLLNYNEGLLAMMHKIALHTGIPLSDDEQAAIKERSLYHAKSPGEKFVEQNIAGVKLGNERLTGLYNAIETLRKG